MKKIFSLLTMLAMVATCSFAQAVEAASATTSTDGAQMTFESELIDYGTIEQGSEPLREFKFTNTGTAPLVISNAKGSCGCTVPVWPKEPIFPGKSAVVEVRYDTKRVGKFTKRVTLSTNVENGESGKIVLTIKGNVNKKAAEPEGLPESQPSILTNPNG